MFWLEETIKVIKSLTYPGTLWAWILVFLAPQQKDLPNDTSELSLPPSLLIFSLKGNVCMCYKNSVWERGGQESSQSLRFLLVLRKKSVGGAKKGQKLVSSWVSSMRIGDGNRSPSLHWATFSSTYVHLLSSLWCSSLFSILYSPLFYCTPCPKFCFFFLLSLSPGIEFHVFLS